MARLGAWSALPNSMAVEALARSGADFVGLDAQHGAHDFRDLVQAIQLLDLLGVESLVRICELELELIPRVLDFGASGVIVSMVEEPETARRAVALTRYQPDGIRSYGGRRYGLSPEPDELRDVRPAVHVMIETRQALDRLEEIAAVPGLTGLFFGPVDLALALGLTGPLARRLSEEFAGESPLDAPAAPGTDEGKAARAWREACLRVVLVAHEHNLEAGTFARGGADARYWTTAGFDRVVVASDIALLRAALEREFRVAAGTDR
jgi:2-keto-3-deoxy-L-rhamnonate aldolase RhmA